MSVATMATGGSRVAHYAPRLVLGLLIVSLLLLAAAPVGWRTGLIHFRTGFFVLMQYSAFAGAAAGIIALISLVWWGGMSQRGRAVTMVGIVAGAFFVYWPVQWYAKVYPIPYLNNKPLPIIHDITTDMTNPPKFAMVIKAREAESGNPVDYDPKVGEQQKAGYPDIAPVTTSLPPAEAFKRALEAAQSMSGWAVVGSDPAQGHIEASQSSRWFGFTDDVAIRVSAEGSGSRIDMRSVSRQGRSDFGVNAQRIRDYAATLKQRLG